MVVIDQSYKLYGDELSTPLYYKFYFGEGDNYNVVDDPKGVTIYQYVEDTKYEWFHKNIAIIMSSDCFEMRDDVDGLLNLLKDLFYNEKVSNLALW